MPLAPHEHPRVSVRIRCLQVQRRAVEARTGDRFEPAEAVDVDGTRWVPWDEAVEHEVDLDVDLDRDDGVATGGRLESVRPIERAFVLDAARSTELLATSDGEILGRAVRRREQIDGLVRVTVAPAGGDRDLLTVAVEVENTTGWCAEVADRDAVMSRSLLAVHTLLAVDWRCLRLAARPAGVGHGRGRRVRQPRHVPRPHWR